MFFASVFMIGAVHAASLYDKLDAWKDFYNPAADGVFDKYRALEDLAEIYPPTTIEITTTETVYLKIKHGKLKEVSKHGKGNIELTTSTEIIDSPLSAKNFRK